MVSAQRVTFTLLSLAATLAAASPASPQGRDETLIVVVESGPNSMDIHTRADRTASTRPRRDDDVRNGQEGWEGDFPIREEVGDHAGRRRSFVINRHEAGLGFTVRAEEEGVWDREPCGDTADP